MKKKKNSFKVDFIGAGVDRAGTSWIYKCLEEHPEICFSKPKETHFFKQDYKKGLKYYQSYFKHCSGEKIKGEFSPTYIYHQGVDALIKKHFPEVKILICLRNPIEKLYSRYFFRKSKGLHPNLTFKESITKYPQSIERSRYYNYLKNWLKLFIPEKILVLIYEDIQKNPLKFIQDIYSFLEVNPEFVPSNLCSIINPSTKKLFYFSFLRKYNLNKAKKNVKKYFPVGKTLIKLLKINLLVNFLIKKNIKDSGKVNLKPISKPPISAETRKYLQKVYQLDIKKLEKLLNRDLSFWR